MFLSPFIFKELPLICKPPSSFGSYQQSKIFIELQVAFRFKGTTGVPANHNDMIPSPPPGKKYCHFHHQRSEGVSAGQLEQNWWAQVFKISSLFTQALPIPFPGFSYKLCVTVWVMCGLSSLFTQVLPVTLCVCNRMSFAWVISFAPYRTQDSLTHCVWNRIV